MLAAAFRRIQARAGAFAEQSKRHGYDDKAQTADVVHDEPPGIVGNRQMIEILHDRRPRGRNARNAFEERVEGVGVVARQVQRYRRHESDHDPSETRNRKRLLPVQPTGFDTQEAQAASHDQGDTDRQQIVARRLPFAASDSDHEGNQEGEREEQDQNTEIMPDHPHIM